ncbi:MAG: cytochrome c3 family protein, partial [Methylococcales bacterium]|nr:cytochrome c3 family protein [Methylococcales bacterium]
DFDASKDLPTTSRQCVVCHDASNMNGKFELDIDLTMFSDKPNKPTETPLPYQDQNEFCLRCHNRNHQQTNYPIIHAGRRNQSIAAEDDYWKIDKHGVSEGTGNGLYSGLRDGYAYKTIVNCVDCHTMHGTTDANLLIDDSRNGAIFLDSKMRNKPYSVKLLENNTNYSQFCALCHNMKTVSDGGEIDTGNGLSGVHFNNGSDCVTCHNHGERVQKGL